ncbi:MAG TPA: hypothetical protein VGL64_15795 [Amycolatopsis sp.]
MPEAEFDRAVGLLDGTRGARLRHRPVRLSGELPVAAAQPDGTAPPIQRRDRLADALLLGLASRDEERATGTSELLTTLRFRLIQGDSRDYVPRRKPGGAKRS